ncbi:MAG: bifunctional metallophosphatase/5'-nucleotidase [Lachnospiraceae bacterium]|nr:bifunctional metallophosphatase/5'-nucleotidase [Lachnospiraceae bacterium]
MKKRWLGLIALAMSAVVGLSGCSPEMIGYYTGQFGTPDSVKAEAADEFAVSETAEAPVAEEVSEEPEFEGPRDVVVLFTSDIHCGVNQNFSLVGLKAVRDALEKKGALTLLVDDGDAIQGEALGTITTGEAIIDLMNAMDYDIAIPGNHEFDYGMDRFFELVDRAKFPYISCNFNKEGELVFDPYIIKEIGDYKIGFVGVTTPETLTSSTPKYFQDKDGNYVYGFFQDETGQGVYDAVQSAVDAARADGADYVFVMGHVGNEAECEPWTYADIISNTNGIDAFMDGHSHDTDHVVMKNKDGEDVPRQACGTKLNGIGYVRISAEDGAVTAGLYSWVNSDITAPELFGFDNEIAAALSEETDVLNEELGKVVAKTAQTLTIYDPEAVDENGQPIRIVRRAETNLGDLCADAIRDQLGTDIALMNGGGARANIEAGDITLNDMMKVQPFGNMESAVLATGQQILDALEWGARAVPEELGGFMQVSGLTYEIHTYIESSCTSDENGMFTGVDGEYRVKNVMVGDEPLDLEKTYSVGCIDYILFNNGDGYTMFSDCEVLLDSIKIDNQGTIDYITGTLGGVVGEEYANPYGQGRIVAVEEAP